MVQKRVEQKEKRMNWSQFGKAMKFLLNEIRTSKFKTKFTGVYGLPRGGLTMAIYLSHNLNIPLLDNPIDGCLITDDIADSGKSLKNLLFNSSMYFKEIKDYTIITIHYKEKSIIKPCLSYRLVKEKDWITYPWEVE